MTHMILSFKLNKTKSDSIETEVGVLCFTVTIKSGQQ
jgi:hypothetical protein